MCDVSAFRQFLKGLTDLINDDVQKDKILDFIISRYEKNYECEDPQFYSAEKLFLVVPGLLIEDSEDDLQYNSSFIKLLIERGADPNSVGYNGEAVLLTAIKQCKISIFRTLLECGGNVNVLDKFGKTPLIIAAQNNYSDFVFHLLTHYRDKLKLDAVDFSNYTALCYSVNNNNIEVLHALLHAGANPNISNISPLVIAIRNNSDLDLIQCLLHGGSSVRIWMDFTGADLLVLATRIKRCDIMLVLIEAGICYRKSWYANPSFMAGLETDDMEVIHLFLAHGVEILSQNYKGSNILHEAAGHGSARFLSYLLENMDININSRDRNGKTAFYLAAQNGHVQCLSRLLFVGADSRVEDFHHMVPLESAVLHNQLDSVKFFLNNTIYTLASLHKIFSRLHEDYRELCSVGLDIIADHLARNDDRIDKLFTLCVLTVRQIMGKGLPSKLELTPLPCSMKKLILQIN